MKPHYEHISLTPGNSWTLYVKRAEALPFLWHYHPEFELTLLENANGHRYVGDSLETFGSGDLVLIGPNQPHCWAADQPLHADAPITAIVIWFDSAWWQHITTRWPEFASLKPLGEASARGVRFSAAAIARVRPLILSMEQQDSAVRLGTLFLVLAELARDTGCQLLSTHGAPTPGSKAQTRLEQVLHTIHADLNNTPGVEELARIAALSTGAFQRFFRRHAGMTVLDYVRQLRIGAACQALIDSTRPIGMIAHEVGYANLAHFNRQFLAAKGMTPRRFRQLHQPLRITARPDEPT